MRKVSDWHVKEECSHCGSMWEVYATDIVERRHGKYRANCDYCGETIRIDKIPNMYSRNFDRLVRNNKMVEATKKAGMEHEIQYLKENSIFFN